MGFAVMTMTDAAADRVKQIVSNSGPDAKGIRVGIKKGGCAGMEYTINLVTEPDSKDDLIEHGGAFSRLVATQQAGIEGSVTLRFSVDADGRVQDVEVVEAKPKRQFERAAIQAINKWRYQPRPGATDKLVQVITLKFKLES